MPHDSKMNTSCSTGWNIVNFNDDNTVAAVPDTWLRENICAWPKAFKDADKIIESRMDPNDEDFYYYRATNMSKKTYSSLTKAKSKLPNALLKSEISSTEDEVIRVKSRPKHKLKHTSPNNTRNKKFKATVVTNQHANTLSVPPIYIPSKDISDQNSSKKSPKKSNIKAYEESDSSSVSVFDDSDGDPTWGLTPKKDSKIENDVMISSFKSTPVKYVPNVEIMSSPNGIWKVSQVNKEDTPMNSINEKKSTNIFETNQKYSAVKSKVQRQLHYTEVNPNQISDLRNMCLTSFSFLKYEVAALKMLCHTMNENIEAMMKEKSTLSSTTNDNLDIESLFPVKNNEDLMALEEKIKIKDLRTSLVSKISLFVGKKDVGNSVRRIMSRMFDDLFLVNYSLYGFKQKQSFTKLSCYRLIIDALRVHVKYKLCTEKEIDEPLGTWLSHAPYRVLPAGEKKPKIKTLNSNDNNSTN